MTPTSPTSASRICLSPFIPCPRLSDSTWLCKGTYLLYRSWGYWNRKITNQSLGYLGQAIRQKDQLTEFKLDLNMWAYENTQISDEGALNLMKGIGELSGLGKLELNMKGWGDGNHFVTDDTIIGLSRCLQKLKNLSEVKLVL